MSNLEKTPVPIGTATQAGLAGAAGLFITGIILLIAGNIQEGLIAILSAIIPLIVTQGGRYAQALKKVQQVLVEAQPVVNNFVETVDAELEQENKELKELFETKQNELQYGKKNFELLKGEFEEIKKLYNQSLDEFAALAEDHDELQLENSKDLKENEKITALTKKVGKLEKENAWLSNQVHSLTTTDLGDEVDAVATVKADWVKPEDIPVTEERSKRLAQIEGDAKKDG